ncbi:MULTISPECIES: restriction endonuclease [unclassified Pseudomonas]|uniref:Restriction endonuclease n=1 Tax=Pseudomonas sp. MYb327 TaxID=2745230 RepID=A0AAU8DZ71_9PSED
MKDLIKAMLLLAAGILVLTVISGIIKGINTYYQANSTIINFWLFAFAATTFLATCVFTLHFHPRKLRREFLVRKDNLIHLTSTIKSLSIGHPGYDLNGFTEQSNYTAIKKSLSNKLVECIAYKNIEPHLQVLRRKRTQLVYTNDYGRKLDEKWIKERDYFISEIMFPLNAEFIQNHVLVLVSEELTYYSEIKDTSIKAHWADWIERTIPEDQSAIVFKDNMTGHEYEHYVAEIIRSSGWTANVTKGSGDHGADIIAENNDERLVVQCKQYSSTVGNKSVQEAYSAQGFYECHHSCVVTNSIFTPAAKQAAKKLGVKLLHHDDLPDYLMHLESN